MSSSPGDLHNPGIEPKSLMSSALVVRFFTIEPGKHNLIKSLGKLCDSLLSLTWPFYR